MERISRFEYETDKFWSERFQRHFENTKLNTFKPDEARRCEDRFGDKGWIVGEHAPIKTFQRVIEGWHWVIRDRDKALVGIKECNLKK